MTSSIFDVTLRVHALKMASGVVNEQRVIIKVYVKLGKTLKDIQSDFVFILWFSYYISDIF